MHPLFNLNDIKRMNLSKAKNLKTTVASRHNPGWPEPGALCPTAISCKRAPAVMSWEQAHPGAAIILNRKLHRGEFSSQ
jgi:hypothetical protein